MIITEVVYQRIFQYIKPAPPETGGILGEENGVVTHFEFDKGLIQAPCSYVPDVDKLNNTIEAWQKQGVLFCGIIHSHMPKENELSEGDKEYILNILKCMPDGYKTLYFPLVIERELKVFKAVLQADKLKIYNEEVERR